MGPYDNELGCYQEDPGIESGQWLEDARRNLWIIPYEPPDRECVPCNTLCGPDVPTCPECGTDLDPERSPEVILHEIPREIEGQDGETVDRILAMLRGTGRDRLTAEEAETLGLAEVPNGLKRFDARNGYYHA